MEHPRFESLPSDDVLAEFEILASSRFCEIARILPALHHEVTFTFKVDRIGFAIIDVKHIFVAKYISYQVRVTKFPPIDPDKEQQVHQSLRTDQLARFFKHVDSDKPIQMRLSKKKFEIRAWKQEFEMTATFSRDDSTPDFGIDKTIRSETATASFMETEMPLSVFRSLCQVLNAETDMVEICTKGGHTAQFRGHYMTNVTTFSGFPIKQVPSDVKLDKTETSTSDEWEKQVMFASYFLPKFVVHPFPSSTIVKIRFMHNQPIEFRYDIGGAFSYFGFFLAPRLNSDDSDEELSTKNKTKKRKVKD